MPNIESLQQLRAALEAQSAAHWWPVLSRLLAHCEGWHRIHTVGDKQSDPAIDEVIDLVESGDTDSDAGFALSLAKLDLARRRAVIRPGIFWSAFDGPFEAFADLAPAPELRTYHDIRTPAERIAYTLLGWALFDLKQ